MKGERNVTTDCWGLRVYTQAQRGAALGLNGGCRARRVQGWQRSTLKAHVRGQWWNLKTRCNEQVERAPSGNCHQDCFRRPLPTELQRRTSRGLAQGELAASNQREDAAGRIGWARRRFVQQVSKCVGSTRLRGQSSRAAISSPTIDQASSDRPRFIILVDPVPAGVLSARK
jgi:hypothetical protein